MGSTMEKGKQREKFDMIAQQLRARVKKNAPLWLFAYPTNDEGFKAKTEHRGIQARRQQDEGT